MALLTDQAVERKVVERVSAPLPRSPAAPPA
jgi:hypothetical protein